MLRFIGYVSLLVVALFVDSLAQANSPSGHRDALLIGNAKYNDFQLPGVSKSLDEVEKALAAGGFAITRHENLQEEELKQAVEDFAAGVPTGGVAVVYYVGLGAHAERFGKWYNLLRPVDEKIESDNEYRDVGLNLEEDLLELLTEVSGANRNIVFLDACWESPLLPEKGNVRSGMREFEPGEGTFVMFAAESGKTNPPSDGDAVSPLAKSISKHLATFDDSIADAAAATAKDAGGCWFAGASDKGIGSPPAFPMTEELREGKQAGEGFVNSIGMTFRWCPPGSFTMGSDDTSDPATRDRTPVEVTLTQGFWMGEHEVTQREYYAVRRRTVGNDFTVAKNAPYWGATEIKSVTEFCQGLTDIERKAGRLPKGWAYVCPTEAQWEYACRAGSKSRYCFGDAISQLGQYGNFADGALKAANPNYLYAADEADDGFAEALALAGSYLPNAWGLRDMHGNVAEIVADHLTPERPGGKDPLVKVEKDATTQIRGGAWCSLPLYCESSFRNGISGRDKYNYVGFRIALVKEN